MQAPQRFAGFEEGASALLDAAKQSFDALVEMSRSGFGSDIQHAKAARLLEGLEAALEVRGLVEKGPASMEEASEVLAPQLRRLAELAAQDWGADRQKQG
jgi:hypothetical protein